MIHDHNHDVNNDNLDILQKEVILVSEAALRLNQLSGIMCFGFYFVDRIIL